MKKQFKNRIVITFFFAFIGIGNLSNIYSQVSYEPLTI
jgi:uncharacterized membrane protein YjjB (DUF3815 family)